MITIDRIRSETGIKGTADLTDQNIQDYIDDEWYAIQKELNIEFAATPTITSFEKTETFDGDGYTLVFLNKENILAISAAKLIATDGTETSIVDDIKLYESGMVYYSKGFPVGVRNVMVTYTYYSDKNALAEQIVKDRVCVDCMLAYGNAPVWGRC